MTGESQASAGLGCGGFGRVAELVVVCLESVATVGAGEVCGGIRNWARCLVEILARAVP